MSRDKSRYSLRSQCRDHGSCDCRHTPGLPNRSRTSRRSRRLNSFNTTGSDITPSEFSDVSSASDFDGSYSSVGSPPDNHNLHNISNSSNIRIITINNIHTANGRNLSPTSDSPFLHPSFGNSKVNKSKFSNSYSVSNNRESESPVSSRSISAMSNRNNATNSSRAVHENLAKFTKYEETSGGQHLSGASYLKVSQKSEVFENGATGTSIHQEHQHKQTFRSTNSSTVRNSQRVTRSGAAAAITGVDTRSGSVLRDEDYLRRRGQETDRDERASVYRGSSVDGDSDVFVTRRRRVAMAAGTKDEREEYYGTESYQTKRVTGLKDVLKVVFMPLYWILVTGVTIEKWFLKVRRYWTEKRGDSYNGGIKLTSADFGGRATKVGRYLYEDDPINEGISSSKFNGYNSTYSTLSTPSRAGVTDTNGRFSAKVGQNIAGLTLIGSVSDSTVGWLGKKALYFFTRKPSDSEEIIGRNADSRNYAQGGYESKGHSVNIDTGNYQTLKSSRRVQRKQEDWGEEIDSAFSEDEAEEGEKIESVHENDKMGIFGFLYRLAILLLIVGLLAYLAYLFWPTAASFAYATWGHASTFFLFVCKGAVNAFSLFASIVPASMSGGRGAAVDQNQKEVLSGGIFYAEDKLVADDESKPSKSHSNIAALPTVSIDEYNTIITRLRTIEDILEDHKERLARHDISFIQLQQQILQLDAAMKAASAKGKSPEQILIEVMNFKLGESSQGKPVTLKSLMSILNESEQKSDEQLNFKLQDMAAKLATETAFLKQNVEQSLYKLDADVQGLKSDQSQMKLGMNTGTVTAEVDMDKIKDTILPVLMTEMQNQVKISCLTKNCPEPEVGPPGGGPSREDVEKLINMAIAKYDADKTGMPDLALEPAGGSILSTRCTKSSKLRNSVVSLWGFRIWSPPNNPRTIIQPGVVPGECWAFEGSVGDVVIKLVGPSIVTGFTLEHIPKSVSPYKNIDSAPYKFQVLGLQEENDFDSAHDYGTFSYEDNQDAIQYFPAANITSTPYPIVELKILSNHGNLLHTCLYRFRVHGTLALGGSQFTATVQSDSGSEE